jgi:8-oxo-dGTP diphosphatase
MSFVGSKAAFVCDGAILTLLRDDKPGLRYADWWDLPGGGSEGDECPEDCLLRELEEEFGLRLGADRLIWAQEHPAMLDHRLSAWFFGGHLTLAEIERIRFGDEGQRWEMMPIARFRAHDRVIPTMRTRAEAFLASL